MHIYYSYAHHIKHSTYTTSKVLLLLKIHFKDFEYLKSFLLLHIKSNNKKYRDSEKSLTEKKYTFRKVMF